MRTLQRTFLAFCLFASTMATPTGKNLALQAVSQGAHLFSTNFVKNVAKEEPGNLICSPLSANIALSMAADGAVGATEAQFKDVLKLPATKPQTLEGYQNLIDKLNNVENVTLKLANKIFIGKIFPVKPEYKQDLETYYRSDIQSVDFAKGDEAANTVNTWCKEKTNNRIDSIISPTDVDPNTALILANAVYFKGKWANEFDPKATTDRPFHIDVNTVREVPTMYRKGNYKYAELPEYDAKCIELPYANKEVSMVIILPNKIDGLAALTDKLEEVSAECSTRLAQTYEREVRVFLPKFKTESKLNLGDTLSQKMGLDKPFSNSAEFGGISDIPLKISKVVQKAFIEVNEEGSEAAAVTDDVDPFTVLILANAVYFKGKWAHEFDPKATTDRPFHIDANTVKEVPTMYRKDDYKYAELPEYDAKCIELPYANKEVSMVIILPNKIDGLAALIDKLGEVSAECNTRLAQTYEREVRVFLPKFKTESKLNFGDTLCQKMGLDKPFSDSAEFGGISDIQLKIDKVVQKAFIEVNEEGSEAAAVMDVEIDSLIVVEVPLVFDVNRPFYYNIRYNKGVSFVSLFEGYVKAPSKAYKK